MCARLIALPLGFLGAEPRRATAGRLPPAAAPLRSAPHRSAPLCVGMAAAEPPRGEPRLGAAPEPRRSPRPAAPPAPRPRSAPAEAARSPAVPCRAVPPPRGAARVRARESAPACVRAPPADNWRGFPEGGKCHLIHTELFKSPHPRADTHTH